MVCFLSFVCHPLSSTSSSLSRLWSRLFFLCYGNSSWQFVTKCSKFINETMGNIKSQLKEAIKSRILIGLVLPLNLFFCVFSSLLSFFFPRALVLKSSELMCSVCGSPWKKVPYIEITDSSFRLNGDCTFKYLKYRFCVKIVLGVRSDGGRCSLYICCLLLHLVLLSMWILLKGFKRRGQIS